MKRHQSHGTGTFEPNQLAACGQHCIFEAGVLIFHPESVRLGENVYVGHQTILKGYYRNTMTIGDGTWIGQQCFLHSAGGLEIGKDVGIGPGVRIITSSHQIDDKHTPILHAPLKFAAVQVGDGADIGVGAIVMPGVSIGRGAQIGAGAVVTHDVPDYAVAAGVPARIIAER